MSSLLNKLTGGKRRDAAPSFTLTGASGATFSLDRQRGVKRTLLIFYPEDLTSG